jgi:hypothetical protein
MTEHDADVATDSLVDVQVAMHTTDIDAVGLGDLAKRDDYVGRQLKRWRDQVERVNIRDLPLMVELHERMARAKPREVAPPALAHGDYRFDNTVMNDEYKIVAVLDWELCTIGNPVADFAWSMLYWTDPGATMFVLSDPPTLEPIFCRSDEVIRRIRLDRGSTSRTSPTTACSPGGSRRASSRRVCTTAGRRDGRHDVHGQCPRHCGARRSHARTRARTRTWRAVTPRPDPGPDRRPSIILDCDPGVDDTLAILTAARYGDLLGITTVNGNVTVDHTTRNALAVTQIAKLDVPVHRGAERPLLAPVHGATRVHGVTGSASSSTPSFTAAKPATTRSATCWT